jgi:putative transposase
MDWARILAYITGTVEQALLLPNEYLGAENGILKTQITGQLLLCDIVRATLAELGHRLGRRALTDVANAPKPDTIVRWCRGLAGGKFDGSKRRRYPGRPRVDRELEQLVVRMAKENRDWGSEELLGFGISVSLHPTPSNIVYLRPSVSGTKLTHRGSS